LVEEEAEVEIGQVIATVSPQEQSSSEPQQTPAEVETEKPPETPSEMEIVPENESKTATPDVSESPKDQQAIPPQISAPAQIARRPQGQRRIERVRMSGIRKKTAERLVHAQQTAAYLTTFNEIDMQKVVDIRNQYKTIFEKEHGARIGFMSFFVKACCQALKEYPGVNSMLDGEEIIHQYFYDIGVAISMDEGLIVPVIRDADLLCFAGIETTIVDMAQRARSKKIKLDELTGGTFTITNGGVFGSMMSTPIPVYPQTAILGLHAIKKRPVVIEDQVVIRPMMYVALSYDHRVIDGRQAIGFLMAVKGYIEEPDKLLLEM
jgi:2-oxoglutarate dehydrogenase E2 component (dihydrolipoamide succinyltransferase)